MTRRLIREGDPPAGQLASPVPQYWNPNTEAFEDVLGAHGAPRAILYGPNGQPIGSSNPLPVADSALAQAVAQLATEGKLEEARALLETISQKDFATQTTLSEVLQRLEAIEEQLETGDAKVQLKGSSVPYAEPLYVNRPVRSQVQTLLNAVSVPAGGNTGWVDVSPGGERYIILLFNCDQPWRAWTNAPWAPVPYGFLYPRRDDADQNPHAISNYPARSVVVAPLYESGVTSMAEAFAAALPWSGLRVQIDNQGAATATIRLRVLRLFV